MRLPAVVAVALGFRDFRRVDVHVVAEQEQRGRVMQFNCRPHPLVPGGVSRATAKHDVEFPVEVSGELQPLGELAIRELIIDEHPVGVGNTRAQAV